MGHGQRQVLAPAETSISLCVLIFEKGPGTQLKSFQLPSLKNSFLLSILKFATLHIYKCGSIKILDFSSSTFCAELTANNMLLNCQIIVSQFFSNWGRGQKNQPL